VRDLLHADVDDTLYAFFAAALLGILAAAGGCAAPRRHVVPDSVQWKACVEFCEQRGEIPHDVVEDGESLECRCSKPPPRT
jgi:hypothetical protein